TILGGLLLVACVTCLAFLLKELLLTKASASPSNTLASKIVPTALVGYGVLFALSTAVGRLCIDQPEAAQKARYMPYLAIALLGSYFCLISARRNIARNISLGVLLAMVIVSSISVNSTDRGLMAWRAQGKQKWKDCYVAQHDISRCNALSKFQLDPDPDGGLQNTLTFFH